MRDEGPTLMPRNSATYSATGFVLTQCLAQRFEKLVDLILVVADAKLRRLKTGVDDIARRERGRARVAFPAEERGAALREEVVDLARLVSLSPPDGGEPGTD